MSRNKQKKRLSVKYMWVIAWPLAAFCVLGFLVAVERAGVGYADTSAYSDYLPPEAIVPRREHKPDTRCLMIVNSSDVYYSGDTVDNITFVLDQMNVGYNLIDIGKKEDLPPLDAYKTLLIACEDMEEMENSFQPIFEWVEGGGGLLFMQTPVDFTLFEIYQDKLGINTVGLLTLPMVPQITAKMETDLMPGGRGVEIPWCDTAEYRYGGYFKLSESSIVHMTSTGPEGATPMLWEHKTGRGRVVVNNNDAMGEFWSRGLVAAAYSLTEQAVAYPVINASLFFIDDFPAPVPEGFNPYIMSDYGLTTDYFFVNVWFPDMLRMAEKYKLKYTGVLVESYDDKITPPFPPAPDNTIERLKYFGAIFLNEGFEIGLHGYNHQSIVFQDFDYKGLLPYNKWESEEHAVEALREAIRLHRKIFPGAELSLYIPPSNVLSERGRALIKERLPEIKIISSLSYNTEFNFRSDFGTAEDGLINIPRIVSGYDFFDDAVNKWAILNELNLHFVNSIFIHPDDVLDAERGAEKGWAALSKSFNEYLDWLSGFGLRNMTGHEAGGAVQRFDNLTVRAALSENVLTLDLDGFYDEAWLLVRVNEGVPQDVYGGRLTNVSEKLFLLKAESAHIDIYLGPGSL